jgi:hypothetical protein
VSARTRGDWILWGALGCTLVGTAHAEYTLTTATGVHWFVAASVPGALDLYVIRALQVHRDVLAAVVAMVAINVASHLVTAGVLPMHWAMISAVGALAPLVLWRIHYLWRMGVQTSAPGEDAPEPESAPALDWTEDRIPDWVHDRVRVQEVLSPTSAPESAPALNADAPKVHPSPDAECVLDSDRRNQGRTSMRALRAEYGWGQPRATSARADADSYIKWKKEVQL